MPNLLGDLVAKSMVVHEPGRRRYSLLETMRLFAAERLDEAGWLRRRSSDCVATPSPARPPSRLRRTWLSTLTAARSRDDLDNVRLAFFASLDAATWPTPSTSRSVSAHCGATPSPTPRGAGGSVGSWSVISPRATGCGRWSWRPTWGWAPATRG